METIETVNSIVLQGEKVTSHLQLAGQCMICSSFVTHRSIRYCDCGRVVCALCAGFWEDENRAVCPTCFKKLQRRRFWRRVGSLLVSPFLEETSRDA